MVLILNGIFIYTVLQNYNAEQQDNMNNHKKQGVLWNGIFTIRISCTIIGTHYDIPILIRKIPWIIQSKFVTKSNGPLNSLLNDRGF